jgi:Fur family ferric uptake transcriptional regulator
MSAAPPRPRRTAQGELVRTAMLAQPGFRSAQDIYATLRAQGHSVGLSTVYRHLQTFAEQGLADVIYSGDGESTYRLCGTAPGNRNHHHHLVCRRCGRTEEIEGRAVERWLATTAAKHGFVEVDHTVEVTGLCASCAS